MMRVYLLLLTVRMTRIITTIILTEAHEVAVQRAQGPNRARFLSLTFREPWLSQRKQVSPNRLMVSTAEVQSEKRLVGSSPTPLNQNPWKWLS